MTTNNTPEKSSSSNPAVAAFIDALGPGQVIPVSGPAEAFALYSARQYEIRAARRRVVVEGLTQQVSQNYLPVLMWEADGAVPLEEPVELTISLTPNSYSILKAVAEQLSTTPDCQIDPAQIAGFLIKSAIFDR